MAEQSNGQVRLPALPDGWTYRVAMVHLEHGVVNINSAPIGGIPGYRATAQLRFGGGTRSARYPTLRDAVATQVSAIRSFEAARERQEMVAASAQLALDAFGDSTEETVADEVVVDGPYGP